MGPQTPKLTSSTSRASIKDASKIIQELETLYEKERDGNAAVALAGYFSETIHDKNKSLTWLERAVQKRAPTLIGVGLPASFTFIQKDPRFQEILKKVGLK